MLLPQLLVFAFTGFLLGMVNLKVSPAVLILERFFPGGGWVEVLGLSVYSAWLYGKLADLSQQSLWRVRLWTLFSVVFFAQFFLALLGFEQFWMRAGKFHLPIPALVIAGPIYRGYGFFMLFLFLGTILVLGPAWCSYLCYFGVWDFWSAKRSRVKRLPPWTRWIRVGIVILVILTAWGLRKFGFSKEQAGLVALGFLLGAVVVMLVWSRRSGIMCHCVVYCPLGWLADLLGKISPFRIKIKKGCDLCLRCLQSCRYNALGEEELKAGKVGFSCSLCGDCIAVCPKNVLGFYFPGMSPERARRLFLGIVVVFHTCFLALAKV